MDFRNSPPTLVTGCIFLKPTKQAVAKATLNA